MRTKLLAPIAIVFALALIGEGQAADDDGPKAVVKKAITAHGGPRLLNKYAAIEQEFEGTINVAGMSLKFKMKMWAQAPDQMKSQIAFDVNNMAIKVVQAMDGKTGWQSLNGMFMNMSDDELKEAKRELRAEWLSNQLTPLLDERFTLKSMGESKVGGKAAIGVLVKEKGQDDLSLFFDKKTYFLIGMEHTVKDMTSGEQVTQSAVMSDFKKDKSGITRAWSAVIKRDGKDFIKGKVTSARALEKLDKSVFAKPD